MNRSRIRNHPSGFSYTSLLTALAVIAIGSAIAAPSFRGSIESNRATIVANRLLAELNRARSESVMLRKYVSICPSVDGINCHDKPVWSHGLITFHDLNRDGQRSPGERIVRELTTADFHQLHLTSSRNRPFMGYRPDGRGAGTNLTIRVCNTDGKVLRKLIINTGGRARVARTKKPEQCR